LAVPFAIGRKPAATPQSHVFDEVVSLRIHSPCKASPLLFGQVSRLRRLNHRVISANSRSDEQHWYGAQTKPWPQAMSSQIF